MARNLHSILQQHPHMYMHWDMIRPETNMYFQKFSHFLPPQNKFETCRETESITSAPVSRNLAVKLRTKSTAEPRANSEEFSPAMFENLQEAIYRSTPDGKLLFVNQTFREIFGISSSEDLKSISAKNLFSHEEDRVNLWDCIKAAGSLKGMEIPFKKRDGTAFWGLVSARLSNDLDGRPFLDAAIVDISNQKKHELSLRKTKDELDQFVYRASHDLRSPLTSMLGLIDLLKMPDNPEWPRVLEMMERTVLKLDAVIHEITDYSYNASTKLAAEPIDLRQLIEECFEKTNYLSQTSGIDKRILVSLTTPFTNDLKRVRMVMNNLISNAVIFYNPCEKQPFIEVRVTSEMGRIIIDIEDNGIGIAPELQPRIFEMFFRGSALSKGSGLGLYVAREIVEKLRGAIAVKSKPGCGSVFRVELPDGTDTSSGKH